jgi:hypothetical protein
MKWMGKKHMREGEDDKVTIGIEERNSPRRKVKVQKKQIANEYQRISCDT